MRPTREVLVLVHRGAEALVLLSAPDDPCWRVVAGRVEDGETCGEAALRRLREETGLDAPGRVHSLRHRFAYPLGEEPAERRALDPRDAEEILVECYAVEASPGWEPRLNEGQADYRWCAFDEAIDLVRRPAAKEVLGVLARRAGRPSRRQLTFRRPRAPAVFFLRFPSEAAAEEASEVLRGDGFAVRIEPEPAHWLVCARKAVRKDSFDVAEQALTALAVAKGGLYAGYRPE